MPHPPAPPFRPPTGICSTGRPDFPTYLRISITDRCNFRCGYCLPDGDFPEFSHDDILRYEEILKFVHAGAARGLGKVRITGGEPLVRKGVASLVEGLVAVPGISETCLTTNGSLLAGSAADLKRAGLTRITVSLDSLRPDRFREITGTGELVSVRDGIEAALAVGLTPLKINTVLLKGINDEELFAFVEQARAWACEVRFIEYMPMGGREGWRKRFLPSAAVRSRLHERFGADLRPVEGEGPAQWRARLPGAGTVATISPISEPFCAFCNRLRLTAGGELRACLIEGGLVDVRGPLRRGAETGALQDLYMKAWRAKPDVHGLCDPSRRGAGESCGTCGPHECGGMRAIGG